MLPDATLRTLEQLGIIYARGSAGAPNFGARQANADEGGRSWLVAFRIRALTTLPPVKSHRYGWTRIHWTI